MGLAGLARVVIRRMPHHVRQRGKLRKLRASLEQTRCRCYRERFFWHFWRSHRQLARHPAMTCGHDTRVLPSGSLGTNNVVQNNIFAFNGRDCGYDNGGAARRGIRSAMSTTTTATISPSRSVLSGQDCMRSWPIHDSWTPRRVIIISGMTALAWARLWRSRAGLAIWLRTWARFSLYCFPAKKIYGLQGFAIQQGCVPRQWRDDLLVKPLPVLPDRTK